MTNMYRRSRGFAALAAAALIGLAACSGGSSTPQVASLGNGGGNGGSTSGGNGGGRATATGPGNPTQLLDEWATCIHGHGDPSQADPTIDSNRDIDISMRNVSDTLSNDVHGGTGPCSSYLNAASTALRGGQQAPQAPSLAVQLKYAECMRANGVPQFPDPNGSSSTNLSGVDTNSQTFLNADKVCSKKTGEPYYAPGTEAPGVIIVSNCTAPPGKQCPSGGPGANSGSGGPVSVPAGSGGSAANG